MKNKIFYAICICITLFFLILDSQIPFGVANGPLYVCVVFLSFWVTDESFTTRVSLACSALTIFGIFISPATGRPEWETILDRSFSVLLIWLVAYLVNHTKETQKQREIEIKLREESVADLEFLKDLFPTCVTCRKTRVDSGILDDVEDYVRGVQGVKSRLSKRTGICPNCEKRILINGDDKCCLQK